MKFEWSSNPFIPLKQNDNEIDFYRLECILFKDFQRKSHFLKCGYSIYHL